MKRVLLGTTALVALGALPALEASAADRIQLGLGGYYRLVAVGADLDDGADANSPTGFENGAGIREHGIGREGEVHFRGQTTLDNGIKVGVRVELEAETSVDQIDNSYIYFDGGFGRIEAGSTWGPGVIMWYGGPAPISGHGNFASQVQVPLTSFGYHSTYNYRLDSVNDKLVYYSPRLAGFQIGLSYTPDDKDSDPAVAIVGIEESGTGLNPENQAGVHASEAFTIGANYVNTFGNVGLNLYGSYTDSDAEAPVGVAGVEDQSSWNLGGNVNFAGFTVGGSYLRIEDFGNVNGRDRDEWEAGVAYSTGPWTFAIQYMNAEEDPTAAQAAAGASDDESDNINAGINYALGPGINLLAGFQYYDFEASTLPGGAKVEADGEHSIFMLGTFISF